MKVDRLDHLALTVRDIEVSCAFYSQVLGLEIITLDGGRKALHFGDQKINLHHAGQGFEPKAGAPTPGSADLCFVTPLPLSAVLRHLRTVGVEILEGPVARAGAMGVMTSVYFRDPDLNLIEVASYDSRT